MQAVFCLMNGPRGRDTLAVCIHPIALRTPNGGPRVATRWSRGRGVPASTYCAEDSKVQSLTGFRAERERISGARTMAATVVRGRAGTHFHASPGVLSTRATGDGRWAGPTPCSMGIVADSTDDWQRVPSAGKREGCVRRDVGTRGPQAGREDRSGMPRSRHNEEDWPHYQGELQCGARK
ncbi:hypothetical protein C8Q77DRAFT_664681 [Trametes polyzona]|nr:hypothetical protein C8Q77DRAFT_664681 [Trametes polyzona]